MLLNTADAIALGGELADRVYAGAVQVWPSGEPPATEYSVFGGTVPGALTTHDDAALGSWLAQQFYSATPSPLSVVGVRLYVPPGSAFIGQSVSFGLARRAADVGGIWREGSGGLPLPADFVSNGAMVTMPGVLVEGWNDCYYGTAWPMLPDDGLIVAYRVGDGKPYLYNGTMLNTAYPDTAGVGFVMAAATGAPGAPNRCVYDGSFSQARWYGLDILVTEA